MRNSALAVMPLFAVLALQVAACSSSQPTTPDAGGTGPDAGLCSPACGPGGVCVRGTCAPCDCGTLQCDTICGRSCGACLSPKTCNSTTGMCEGGGSACDGVVCQTGETCNATSGFCGCTANSCPGNQVCSSTNRCACPAGQAICGSTCVNTANDPQHCGSCDKSCSTSEVCGGSTCVLVCQSGTTSCSGSCVDLSSDPQHCLHCDTPCPAGASCHSGQCVGPADAGSPPDASTSAPDGGALPPDASANSPDAAVGPFVSLSPTVLDFGSQAVGSTSAPRLVTVSNVGDATLIFSVPALTGDFDWGGVGTCAVATPQAAGTSCTMSVVFKPTAAGTRDGVLTIADNAQGGQQTAALTGVGQSAAKPTISAFSANPTAIASGGTSTLSWTTQGATSLAIDPGGFTSTSASGSTTVSPTSTTTYTLTATNTSGSTTATAQVTVSAAGNAYANFVARYQSYSQQHYVSPSGTGSTCSQTAPCSMTTGMGLAGAGVVIWFLDGTYPTSSKVYCGSIAGTIATCSGGSSSAREAFVALTRGGAKIVNTPASNNGWPVWLVAASYVDIVGFDISTTGSGNGNTCAGIDTLGAGSNNIFAFNLVHDIPASLALCGSGAGGGGINTGTNTTGHSLVLNNIVWNIGAPGNAWTHGFYDNGTGDVIENNISYGNSGAGIQCYHNCQNEFIVNNTVVNNGCEGIIVGAYQYPSMTGMFIANNIIDGNGFGTASGGCAHAGFAECDGSSCGGASGNTITNNLIHNNSQDVTINGGTDQSVNAVNADPLFVTLASPGAGGDLHLQTGSQAIGKGTATNAPATDLDGVTRASPPSIGAYEQ